VNCLKIEEKKRTGLKMFGVVLWSDADERKAVIWCEDHGDLAFYNQPDVSAGIQLDAGDWVQFDLTMDRQMRLAHNPRLVQEGVCHDLAGTLYSAVPKSETPAPPTPRGSAEIIPIDAFRNGKGATDGDAVQNLA
jgi:hypothetical protein